MKLSLQAEREIQYSFEALQPYYLLTGISVSVVQRIFGPVDLQARAGRQQLAYRNRDAAIGLAERVDFVRSYGGGVGYRMSRDLRLGLNVDQQKRDSGIVQRRYNGLRYGVSVTYGE
jgi:hypothetical protein